MSSATALGASRTGFVPLFSTYKGGERETHTNTGGKINRICRQKFLCTSALNASYSFSVPFKMYHLYIFRATCRKHSCFSLQKREFHVNMHARKTHACLLASSKMRHWEGLSCDPLVMQWSSKQFLHQCDLSDRFSITH